VQPVQRLDSKEAAALVDDLDSSAYAVREKAMQRLAQLESARPALKEALANNPPLEVRRRIELVLAKLPDIPWDPILLRNRRAVTALEQIGTPEARQLLRTIAEGVSEARLTKAARESLDRLAK
jgi:HEAT repeat protein